MSNITSKELSERLGCSQRHALRLLKANDPRVRGAETEWSDDLSRKRLAENTAYCADSVERAVTALHQAERCEPYHGPLLEDLAAVREHFARAVQELRTVGRKLQE